MSQKKFITEFYGVVIWGSRTLEIGSPVQCGCPHCGRPGGCKRWCLGRGGGFSLVKTLIFVQVCTEIQIYFSNRVYSKHWNIGLGLKIYQENFEAIDFFFWGGGNFLGAIIFSVKNVCVIKEENQFALIGRGRRSWFIVRVGKDFH